MVQDETGEESKVQITKDFASQSETLSLILVQKKPIDMS